MRTIPWLLLAALATPAAAAPLTSKDIASADRQVTRLSVELGDKDVESLARFENLRELLITGPYNSRL